MTILQNNYKNILFYFVDKIMSTNRCPTIVANENGKTHISSSLSLKTTEVHYRRFLLSISCQSFFGGNPCITWTNINKPQSYYTSKFSKLNGMMHSKIVRKETLKEKKKN